MPKPIASRMRNARRSFLRELMKTVRKPGVISLAGGLPNPHYFPVDEMAAAAQRAFARRGASMLQYAPTNGHRYLRQFVVDRYAAQGVAITPDDVLITTGAQQGIDLAAKVVLDPGDEVIVEEPSYLGAIQGLGLYEPQFVGVPLEEDGIALELFAAAARQPQAKLFYCLPNFQNPSGLSYGAEKRAKVAGILQETGLYYIEDDPYHDLWFDEAPPPPLRHYGANDGFLLGSFSKIVSPGMRLGWTVAPPPLMDRLIVAKQGADLHSSQLAQEILVEFLRTNDVDAHIARVRGAYRERRDLMIEMIEECFPPEVRFTRPKGGMFLWLEMPASVDTMALFHKAVEKGVVFVPGEPFFTNDKGRHSLRLSFSRVEPDEIERGIKALAEAIQEMLTSPEM